MPRPASSGARPRVASMLRLDFHRLFHTPILYVMLTVSAIIPALLLTTTGLDASGAPADPSGRPAPPSVEHTNVWQLIESTGRSGGADPLDFGGYANINMVFIFAGLLMAIFVAHDYISGFVKNIFSVHPQKADYVISKTVIGIFSGAGMILAYVFGSVIAGLITGQAFDVAVSGLIWCLLSKILLMGVFCALFLGVAVFFRSKLWITIVFTFLLGMTLYPAASVATLDSTPATTLASLLAGTVGAVGLGAVSTLILNRRDLA